MAGIGAIAVAAVTVSVLNRSSGDNVDWLPTPGTYAESPIESWSFELSGADSPAALLTQDSLVLSEEIPEGRSRYSTVERLTAIDLETGTVSWQRVMDEGSCWLGVGAHAADARMILCEKDASPDLHILDPKDGKTLGHPTPAGYSNYYITGDTIYSCAWNGDSVVFSAGTATELSEHFSVKIPVANSNACTISVEGDYAAATSSSNWLTVVGIDGSIKYQSFDVQGEFIGDQLLATQEVDGDEPYGSTPVVVRDLEGNEVYRYSEPIEIAREIPGRRFSDVFVDNYGDVRDRGTGEARWNYPERQYSLVGLSGDVLVTVEDETQMRGYSANDGQSLWDINTDRFFPIRQDSANEYAPDDFESFGSLRRVTGDGETMLVTTGSRLTALDTEKGAISWTFDTKGWVFREHQNLLLLSDGETLRALKFG
ncbi:outer membrane protein assembly factor BamB family protein [Rhodococcus pyridinivorans]|uniref:outer membrane protein assembly factor BamB family protein n=1 Tax=Rhodococcus pyridinivorans TaxID=103816 RepID=UPI0020785E80|nr:PQQ-binding-like beta-propeller repeat protein [Rhodococcus pyridinivorans]USI92899.1 PQQ-like beta-propeller repeat protein [Rhodococcus pyridinivorans]